jgi:ABC-type dipeptide/oligopeptide/nickel transport system permease subunit
MSRTRRHAAFARFLHDPYAVAGIGLALLLVLSSLAAPLLTLHDPIEVDLAVATEGPSPAHPFGTDEVGRDILARVLFGGRATLLTAVIAVGLALALGVPIGLTAGYAGGWADMALMRAMDLMLAFPGLLLAILIVTVLGPSAESAMLAVGLSSVPVFARLVRASALMVREMPYVEAARSLGQSAAGIVIRHILPNALSSIVVQSALRMGTAILVAAGLGFLGLGAQPPDPEWGQMLSQGRVHLQNAPHVVIFPSLAILLAVLAFNLAGDGLNDALDPRLSAGRR